MPTTFEEVEEAIDVIRSEPAGDLLLESIDNGVEAVEQFAARGADHAAHLAPVVLAALAHNQPLALETVHHAGGTWGGLKQTIGHAEGWHAVGAGSAQDTQDIELLHGQLAAGGDGLLELAPNMVGRHQQADDGRLSCIGERLAALRVCCEAGFCCAHASTLTNNSCYDKYCLPDLV